MNKLQKCLLNSYSPSSVITEPTETAENKLHVVLWKYLLLREEKEKKKKTLRNFKGRNWCEPLMQCKYTWLYDLGKPLHEGCPVPLLCKELNLDTTCKENKFWQVPSLFQLSKSQNHSGWCLPGRSLLWGSQDQPGAGLWWWQGWLSTVFTFSLNASPFPGGIEGGSPFNCFIFYADSRRTEWQWSVLGDAEVGS